MILSLFSVTYIIKTPHGVRHIVTIAQRRRSLDLDIWRQRPFVIQDPSDPEGILYLSGSEFHKYQGICLSNQIQLTIIARDSTDPSLIGPSQDSKADDGSSSPVGSSTASATASRGKASFHTVSKLKASPSNILKLVGSIHEVGTNLLARLDNGNVIQLYRKYITKVSFWTYGRHSVVRLQQAIVFSNRIQSILKCQGPMGVILRLKVSLIALNAYVGGCPLRSTRDLGTFISLTKDGIPRWIPQPVRAQIKTKDLNTIRMWASILNTFKGIEGTWKKPDTGTICTPALDADFSHLQAFSYAFWSLQSWAPKSLIFKVRDFISGLPEDKRYHISGRAGPSGTPSYYGLHILMDAMAWLNHPVGPFHLILSMCKLLGLEYLETDIARVREYITSNLPVDLAIFEPFMDKLYMDPESPLNQSRDKHMVLDPDGNKTYVPNRYLLGEQSPYRKLPLKDRVIALSKTKQWKLTTGEPYLSYMRLALIPFGDVPPLGRVLCLQEAAGKNRIIAINDFFTQQVMKPLHLWLFEICKCFPQDSTFDQEGALARFVQRTDMVKFFSYDLSSATDLIPLGIYRSILVPLVGPDITTLWLRLLVDKDFKLAPNISSHSNDKAPKGMTRYTRGQPMGALSSWGLMNVAHHLINQYACLVSVIRDIQTHKHSSKYFHLIEDVTLYRIILTSDSPLPLEKVDYIIPGFTFFLTRALFENRILPFDKYITLGDDNVIGEESVANSYFEIVTTTFDIPIKLAKSYVSTSLINFANQTFFNRQNISPIPFKEYLSASGLPARIEFASRVVRRFFSRPSILGLLRYVVSSHTWEIWKKDIGLRKVYEPILPLLYAVTLIKLPSYIPDTDVSDTSIAPSQHTGKFSLIGAMCCLTHRFYERIVGNLLISEWYALIDKPKLAQSPHLRSYIKYMIKVVLSPYLGDPKHSLEFDIKEIISLDRYFPSKMAYLGLVRQRRHETLWLDAARGVILRRATILKRIFLALRRHESMDIDQLCLVLEELLREPDIVGVIPVLKILSTRRLDLISYDYTQDSSFFYERMNSMLQSDAASDKEEHRKRLQDQTANLLLTSTQRFLDMGGILDFETSSVPDGTLPTNESVNNS